MSFSLDVKEELCQTPLTSPCCVVAELLGILLYCHTFSHKEVRITTSSPSFSQRIPLLFQKINIQVPPITSTSGKFVFVLDDPDTMQYLMDTLDYAQTALSCHIQFGLLEETCCQQAMCRGAFLAGGSITHPEKQYHLELHTAHASVQRQFPSVLHESHLEPKLSQRKGRYICYFKQATHIQTFLKLIGAPNSAQVVFDLSQRKNLTSEVNRQVNCDAANLNKAVDAAQNQIKAIRYLEKEGILADLPNKLKETAYLRLENPHCTLTELAEYFTPPISKSALNHRLRKLMAMVNSTSEE